MSREEKIVVFQIGTYLDDDRITIDVGSKTTEYQNLEFWAPFRKTSQKFLDEINDDRIREVVKKLLEIEGIVKVRVEIYTLIVTKARLFSWRIIRPLIERVIL